MEIMAKGPEEIIIYADKVLPWVDHYEYVSDQGPFRYVIFKSDTPEDVKKLFKKLEPKLKNMALKE